MWNGRPASCDFDLALRADVLDAVLEQMRDVRGIGGCGDGHDRLGFRDLPGGGEDGGAAKAVADQDRRRRAGLAQMIGGADEVGDVGREGGVGKIAFAGAEAGEIEPQHRDALGGQRGRDAFGRQHILAAGEAMREQRIGLDGAVGHIERGGELMAVFAGELKAFRRHGRSPSGHMLATFSRWNSAASSHGIAAVVIAADFPIARRILGQEFDALQPFGAFPEIQMRHHQPHRAAVLLLQRLARPGMREQGVLGGEILQRQVGGVAVMGMQHDEARLVARPAGSSRSRVESPSH